VAPSSVEPQAPVAGAIVGGPVGAVAGGAIDQKTKDTTVVVTHEVQRP
jgi:hypothetical protein